MIVLSETGVVPLNVYNFHNMYHHKIGLNATDSDGQLVKHPKFTWNALKIWFHVSSWRSIFGRPSKGLKVLFQFWKRSGWIYLFTVWIVLASLVFGRFAAFVWLSSLNDLSHKTQTSLRFSLFMSLWAPALNPVNVLVKEYN